MNPHAEDAELLPLPTSSWAAEAADSYALAPSVLDRIGARTIARVLAERASVQPWVVENIVHSSSTLLYGDSMVGKSRLTTSIVPSIVQGQDWYGHAVPGGPGRVLILASDDDGDGEYADRMSDLADSDRVQITEAPTWRGPEGLALWGEIAAECRAQRYSLVVLDNLFSWAPEVNWSAYGEPGPPLLCLKQLSQAKVPLLALHHEASSGRGNPAGSVAVRAHFRHKLHLDRTNGGAVQLTVKSNRSAGARYLIRDAGKHVVDVVPLAAGSSGAAIEQASRHDVLDQKVWDRLNAAPPEHRASKGAAYAWLVHDGVWKENAVRMSIARLVETGCIDDGGGGRGGRAALTMIRPPGSATDALPEAA